MGSDGYRFCRIVALALLCSGSQAPFEPKAGQPGKDVVWVPTPHEIVEKMLDMADVTPQDFVMDLGSGDGRNVIAAARRGARGLGVEYNPDLVELSRRLAREAGVANRATFVQGDMYEADVSQATVLALFLKPENLDRMQDKFLAMKPGTRIGTEHVSGDRLGSGPDRNDRPSVQNLVHGDARHCPRAGCRRLAGGRYRDAPETGLSGCERNDRRAEGDRAPPR